MTLVESAKTTVSRVTPAIAPGASRLAAVPAAIAVPVFFASPPIGIGLLLLAIGVVWFHRDPDRVAPVSEQGFLAPADGKISVIREEDTDEDNESRVRVGVFMNVTDVHVNRAPAAGRIEAVTHQPGANRPAFYKDSDRNERLRIDHGRYHTILIAGWFARRIYPYVSAGDSVSAGDRIGHVSFGSRADVLFPPEISRDDLQVGKGDRVRAGETVLADGQTAQANPSQDRALEHSSHPSESRRS